MAYSNALLFDMILCLAERIDECCGSAEATEPVVTRAWPANGVTLTRTEDHERLISPDHGIELTFNRAMDGAKLGAPDSWLGLWAVVTPAAPSSGGPAPPATTYRLRLVPVGSTPIQPSSTMKYAIDLGQQSAPPPGGGAGGAGGGGGSTNVRMSALFGAGAGSAGWDVTFLLAIRAKGTSITDTSGMLLDADFAGTSADFTAVGLSPDVPSKTVEDALWDMNPGDNLTFDVAQFAQKLVAAMPAALPADGSGDGSAGGLFHSAFKLARQTP
jgi:hypothetical protein